MGRHENHLFIIAYGARYSAAFEELLGVEGGLVDDPVDRGGTTKYGVSLRFLKSAGAFDEDGDGIADFDLDFDGDIDGRDIRLLTIGDAKWLYKVHFWDVLQAGTFPAPIGEMLFDQGVNGGNYAARKLLQRAINTCLARGNFALIDVDGKIGDLTRRALDRVLKHETLLGMEALTEAFREAVRDRYRLIASRYPDQRRFLRGWLARAEKLGR
ncbi:MAG: hypothetical protein COW16_10510 [Sphingomonadales bacterium CG12_big_fil_rev_8_21_14_0_65_65_10]|nr:MAG: hypothetical protein COW16_10510 [Sphingomonadales bacterium CG12_big_fil_rev_8_21_14_0_65_65_10]